MYRIYTSIEFTEIKDGTDPIPSIGIRLKSPSEHVGYPILWTTGTGSGEKKKLT